MYRKVLDLFKPVQRPDDARRAAALAAGGPGAVPVSDRVALPSLAAFTPGRIVMILGLAALLIPTIINLGHWSWSSESGAHGPIVLATGLWLIWRDRDLAKGAMVQPFLPVGLLLVPLLPLYAAGRITNILMLESLSLYLILLTLAYLQIGGAVLRRFWFPCLYLLFLITPPENWIFVATRPVKMWLSTFAVDLLAAMGYSVGSTGVMIQIDGYQLLVATACSGINSLIGICALSLFYVYLRHGSEPRYALLLSALSLPLAIVANVVRILILVLITHSFGEAAGQGISHDLAGIGMFLLSVMLLIGLDAVLHPLFRKLGWIRA